MVAIALAAFLQVELLGDDDLDVRERATADLRRAGMDAGPALMRALESPDAEVRSRAEMLLDELAAQVALSQLQGSVAFADVRTLLKLRSEAVIRLKVVHVVVRSRLYTRNEPELEPVIVGRPVVIAPGEVLTLDLTIPGEAPRESSGDGFLRLFLRAGFAVVVSDISGLRNPRIVDWVDAVFDRIPPAVPGPTTESRSPAP